MASFAEGSSAAVAAPAVQPRQRQLPVHHALVLALENFNLLYHLLDLKPEQTQEGELEESDDAEPDYEEGVGAAGEPAGDSAVAAHVVVPLGRRGKGVSENRQNVDIY